MELVAESVHGFIELTTSTVPRHKKPPLLYLSTVPCHRQTDTIFSASYDSTRSPSKSELPLEAIIVQNHLLFLKLRKISTMSCSTAASWMVPDDEYYTKTEDYALVGESANIIRSELYQANNYVAEPLSRPLYYGEILHLQRHEPAYGFVDPSGHMIYADVDDSNPSHERDIKELRSKERKLEDAWEHRDAKMADAARALCIYLEDAWKGRFPPHTAEKAPFLEEAWRRQRPESAQDERMPPDALQAMFHEWKQGQAFEHFEDMAAHRQTPDSKVLKYIFGAGHEHREALMHMISGQTLSPTKRPVMLLVDMFDSRQSPMPGVKTGWVIAYDLLNQNIVIKPFYSDKDHHPLTSSWNHPVVDDGVSYVSTPSEFIKAYHLLAKSVPNTCIHDYIDIESGGHLRPKEPSLAFRMLVHSLAAKWVLRHWPDLIGHWCETPEESTSLFQFTQDDCKQIRIYLQQIHYPMVAKTKPAEMEKKVVVGPFADLEWTLEEMEDYFRAGAVGAQEIGEEKIAKNMAVLYEKIMEMVKAFNQNPRGDICAWEMVQRDEVEQVEEKLGNVKLS